MGGPPPSAHIYVTGLPLQFNDQAAQRFFGVCGIVIQAESLGHGNALVQFASEAEAASTMQKMNGRQPLGCPEPLSVTYAPVGQSTVPDLDAALMEAFAVMGESAPSETHPKVVMPIKVVHNAHQGAPPPPPPPPPPPITPNGAGPRIVMPQVIMPPGPSNGGGHVVMPPGMPAGNSAFSVQGKGAGVLPQGPGPRGGDWPCINCGDLQFARITACRTCGCPREGGQEWAVKFGKASSKGKGNDNPRVVAPYEIKGLAKGDKAGDKGDGKGKGGKGASKSTAKAGTVERMIDLLSEAGLPGANYRNEASGDGSLYLANLPFDTTDEDLYTIFATFGAIPPRGVKVMRSTPGQRVYGFCNFLKASSAEFAVMSMNGVVQPDGCKLIVKMKNKKDQIMREGQPLQTPSGTVASSEGVPLAEEHQNQLESTPEGVDSIMWKRLTTKLAQSEHEGEESTSESLSQWYIIENLGHVVDEEEMKAICDMLLTACVNLGLP